MRLGRAQVVGLWFVLSCDAGQAQTSEATTGESTSTSGSVTTDMCDSDTGVTGEPFVGCPASADEPAQSLSVEIINTRAEPVYLQLAAPDPELGPGYFVQRAYDLVANNPERVVNARGQCHDYKVCHNGFWCPYLYDPDFDPCKAEPTQPPAIKIMPGGSYRGADLWNGLEYSYVRLDNVCLNQLCPAPACRTRCLRGYAYSGPLTARIRVGETATCAEPPCDCEPNPGYEWCWVGQANVEDPEIYEQQLTFPGPATVQFNL